MLSPGDVLVGSGRTRYNAQVLDAYRATLPPHEAEALFAFVAAFYGYQQTWLLDQERFSLLVKARQIGASHAYAAAAVLWGLVGEGTSVISQGEREAIEVLEKAAKHCDILSRLGSTWATVKSKTTTTLRMASGAVITSLPSTSGGRGQSGNVLLDESAYHQHPEKTYDGASGSVTHGYRLRLMSTPNGAGNLFHRLATDRDAQRGWRLHRVTVEDAIADGLAVDVQDLWTQAHQDPRVFDQLFRCSFLDNADQYLPFQLVRDASVKDTYCYEGECFAGLDIGRTADRTVLYVLRQDAEGVCWEQRMVEKKRTSQDDIDAMVAQAFKDYPIRRLCVDATGMGAFPAEALQKRYGRFRVEPVNFTLDVKEDLATTIYQRLSERAADGLPMVRIAQANQQLRDDLCAIRRIITSAGNVRYDAPHTEQGHADAAWAFALALHATVQPSKRKHEAA